ncbi:hypothetical protein AKJ56_02390 [candidate division MSBL1 archaeon SCGC-AAA382N08]|uniref:Uncharacterized protein n=1 Tax=candidate division MSBL1 archaeon SCGC-AAA382N08 TaxID=1698285 RepID=A0A133VMY0_9EURY|nr:hypothetical protein AKJ56_02390 [candidate division MSBL1 archaeon SCGC-AAA382N08]
MNKIFKKMNDASWERGRENGSFPVAEILKPLGFRKFCENKILLSYLAGKRMPGLKALKQ